MNRSDCITHENQPAMLIDFDVGYILSDHNLVE